MTTIEPAASIALATALLEAIARDSGQAVDFDAPLRCGQAANRRHTVLGFSPTQGPTVGDDAPTSASRSARRSRCCPCRRTRSPA